MKDADSDFLRVENSAKESPSRDCVSRPIGLVMGRLVMFGSWRCTQKCLSLSFRHVKRTSNGFSAERHECCLGYGGGERRSRGLMYRYSYSMDACRRTI